MSTRSFPPLPPELVAFAHSGLSVLIGTRDAVMRPDAVRGVGVKVWPDADGITVYLAQVTSARGLANLRDNGRLAVTLSSPPTHRTIQLKGTVRELREARAEERAVVEAYRAQFVDTLASVGMSPAIIARLSCWPAHAAEMPIDEVFEQTPGPNAGVRLGHP